MRRAAATFACVALLSVLHAASARPPEPPSTQPYGADARFPLRWKVVLVAGDASLPVFDDAVDGVAARLREQGGVLPGDIQRLSAMPEVVEQEGARPASLDGVLDAVASMRPAAGQGCLVFATSHGAPYQGLVLTAAGRRQALSPEALDRALASGCGDAPTAVVVSGCFTGTFAHAPMARPNRIVLTAARPDRTSFGCGAGRAYTVYDRCLLDALDAGGTWQQAYGLILRCVTAEERKGRFTPSGPQAWFGPAVADMKLPVAATPQAR